MTPDPTGLSAVSNSTRWIAAAGAAAAFLGVAAGAFGAHLLSERLASDALETFEIGVRYQLYHGLGLLAVAALAARMPTPLWSWAAGLMVAGVIVFSGTLYGLALGGPRWLGAVTPVGGLCFLAAWVLAAVAALRGAAS